MQITKVVIDQFCSVEHAEVFPSMFNVLVGQNNHGKTNVFEALNWFYTNKGDVNQLRFGRKGNAEVSVEVEFAGVQAALASMKNDKNRVSIEKVIGTEDWIRSKRSSVDPKIRKIFDPKNNVWLDKNPTGFDSAFNDLLPMLEYVDTSTHLNDVAKFSKTSPIGTMLAGVLMALLETSQPYKDFRQKFDELFTAPGSDVRIELDKIGSQVTLYIAKQFPDCTLVTFQITEPAFEELLKGCTTEIDDGIVTNAAEKGDGMQRALMLAILQTYADFRRKGEASGKCFLFLIDEAELHPLFRSRRRRFCRTNNLLCREVQYEDCCDLRFPSGKAGNYLRSLGGKPRRSSSSAKLLNRRGTERPDIHQKNHRPLL
ncbi:MAG: AAA family ATPase [Terracidiphilus sp.]